MDETISQEGFTDLGETDSVETNEQLTLFSLQDMAITITRNLEQIRKELKDSQDMLSEAMQADPQYQERQTAVNEVSKALKETKETLSRRADLLALQNKIKELKAEAKGKKNSISEYALEVFRQSGVREFEKDGKTYEIKTIAKLVERKQ